MKILLQLTTELAPVIITGLITFLITKYTCDKNVPLDKIEIAYNRIYYPLSKLLRNDNVSQLEIQNKMDYILLKYDKYLSQTTKFTYLDYKNDINNNVNSDKYFATFTQNVFEYDSNYRKLLGYPQAKVIESFRYMKYIHKLILLTLILLIVIYSATILYTFIQSEIIVAIIALSAISVLFFIIVILGYYSVTFIKKKIKSHP